jgi:anti-anti-sigma factor
VRVWQVLVTVLRIDNAAAPYRLSFDRQPVTIGASVDNDIVLEGTGISNQHAQITMSRGVLSIQNQSRNGTYVGDERVERHSLRAGEVVRIPPYELRFELIVASDEAADGTVLNVPRPVEGTIVLPARGKRKEALCLEVVEGPQIIKGKRFDLPREGLRIGRSPDTDLCIDMPTLSRNHAEIRPTGQGEWQLRDLESANGTFLNGTRVKENRIRAGDELTLAEDVVIRIVDDAQLGDTTELGGATGRKVPNKPPEPTPAFFARGDELARKTALPGSPATLLRVRTPPPLPDTATRKPAFPPPPASAHTFAIHSRRADWNKHVLILQVEGRVDGYNYTELGLALDRIVDAGERNAVIDLSNVAYIDHTGLGVLLKAITAVERYGGRICLIGANQRLMDSISLSRLDSFLKGKLFPDERTAQKEFGKQRP